MNSSENTDKLFEALAQAQGELANPKKNRKANAGKFSYSYADIADVTEAVRPVLAKHGLSFLQPTFMDGNALMIETQIAHSSGQWVSSTYPVCTMGGDHQSMGSAMTYARRYALCSMLGIAADDDVDGANAAGIDADAMPKTTRAAPASKRKSSAQAKRDGDYNALVARLDSASTLDELKATWSDIYSTLGQLPAAWREPLTDRKDACKAALEKAETALIDPAQFLENYKAELADCESGTEIKVIVDSHRATLDLYPEDTQRAASELVLEAFAELETEAA